MKYSECIVNIQFKSAEMLGIITLPASGAIPKKSAVLIITGGAQYRIGSHRQFTRMARQLAGAGYPVMRFDMPGMGDSAGPLIPFDQTTPAISAAVDLLERTASIKNIFLWGLCDGASASLLYIRATQDERIAGLVLLNPWIRSEISLARAYVKYYYPKRLLDITFWSKALHGRIGIKTVKKFFETVFKIMKIPRATPSQSLQNQMAKGWIQFRGPILLMLSEYDLVAQEFKEFINNDATWRAAIQKKTAVQHTLLKSDHTCSTEKSHNQMANHTLEWLNSIGSDFCD